MTLRVAAGFAPSLLFENPVEVWAPRDNGGALFALRRAEAALRDGYWIAGALAYELAGALTGIETHAPVTPLLVLGAFREPRRLDDLAPRAEARIPMPLARVARSEYDARLAYVLNEIRDGEVYQVNYTVPFDVALRGEAFDLFALLAERSEAPYSAYLEYGDLRVVSISPELFLRFEGSHVETKPMKGTAPLHDVSQLRDPKNRAEHVMIVDLLRNDLHRVCEGVRVERLFEIERYPTFATMTSTIAGKLRNGVTLEGLLRAAFPCGSVTGAPKRAAMQHITTTEREARGFYTGSIGFLSPQRQGWWNVAIRTLQFDGERGRVDIGGGIVSDSTANGEWAEILLKARYLQPAWEGFALLETLRAGAGAPDPAPHLDRLMRSAERFGITVDRTEIASRIAALAGCEEPQLVRIRAGVDGVSFTAEPLAVTPEPAPFAISNARVRSADPFLAHKTSWRAAHEAAAAFARERGCFDAALRNERGEITEGARTNIFARIGNTLYTPPLGSGVLPGILRSRLVSDGTAVERILFAEDLAAADAVYAGNSARGLIQVRLVK